MLEIYCKVLISLFPFHISVCRFANLRSRLPYVGREATGVAHGMLDEVARIEDVQLRFNHLESFEFFCFQQLQKHSAKSHGFHYPVPNQGD
jgi:hypothetical protein